MINKILERGFIALAVYSYLFALISLILFVVAVVATPLSRTVDSMWRRSESFCSTT